MLIIYIIKIAMPENWTSRENFRGNDLVQKLHNRFEIPWNLRLPSMSFHSPYDANAVA